MKKIRYRKIIIVIFVVNIILLVNFGNSETVKGNIKSSDDIWYEKEPYIKINGNIELDAYCSIGDGLSWETAYIIENLILPEDEVNAIEINNTSDYLIIRNSEFQSIDDYIYSVILLTNCQNVKIINCSFDRSCYPIQLINTNNTEISNNTIKLQLTTWSRAIRLNDSNYVNVSENIITGNGIENFGINFYSSKEIEIFNNTFRNLGQSTIHLSNCLNSLIYNNNIIDNQKGIICSYSDTIKISNNNISNTSDYAISLYRTNNSEVDNNMIRTIGSNGIELNYYSTYNILKSNNISDCDYSGISFHEMSNYNLITTNNISHCKKYGLDLESLHTCNNEICSSPSSYNNITYNQFYRNEEGCINYGTGSGNYFEGNTCIEPLNKILTPYLWTAGIVIGLVILFIGIRRLKIRKSSS